MIKDFIHKDLAAGRWFTLSLAEQLGNIGSEYYRATKAKAMNNENRYNSACDRTMELSELTLNDKRWYHTAAFKEVCRMNEQIAWSLYDQKIPDPGLQKYFDGFAILARKDR